jgi:death-on-curing protein
VTHYLTPEQVLFVHSRLISETGGEHGVRDLGMLLSALGRPQASFEGNDLYPDLWLKTAALMDSLIRNHPFLDGNKRSAIASAALFLRANGVELVVENKEMARFTLGCAQSRHTLDEMAAWFRRHTSPLSSK